MNGTVPEQLDMPARVRQHLETEMIGKHIDRFLVKDVLGSGNTAVTYEVKDDYGAEWALKLVTKESYGERAPLGEVVRFSGVEGLLWSGTEAATNAQPDILCACKQLPFIV